MADSSKCPLCFGSTSGGTSCDDCGWSADFKQQVETSNNGDIVISESTHDESVLSVPASAVDENVFVRTVSGDHTVTYKKENEHVELIIPSSPKSPTKDKKVFQSHPLIMPATLKEFCRHFEQMNSADLSSIIQQAMQSDVLVDPPYRQLLRYPLNSLKIGRPLNTVMIFMAGQSGSGKSTTINKLFEDDLCKTNSSTSETHEVTEYRKLLDVKNEQFPLQGYLSFVDAPGTHDVYAVKDNENIKTMKKFRKENYALKKIPRAKSTNDLFKSMALNIRKHVYPNLILLTFNATDNRIEGPDSKFAQTLKVLKETGLFDKKRNNLIVVVTHSMSLGIMIEEYIAETTKLKKLLKRIVCNLLNLTDVRIVFIENKPEKYMSKKEAGNDFYRLPDGELSHWNLFQAITDQFQGSCDSFGLLLTGYYFGSDVPEKNQKAEVCSTYSFNAGEDLESDDEPPPIPDSGDALIESIRLHYKEKDVAKYKFMYLGYGYCPTSESHKLHKICNEMETKNEMICNRTFAIPVYTEVTHRRENYLKCITFKSKCDYEKERVVAYGLDLDIKLIMDSKIDPMGRWEEPERNAVGIVSFLYELRFAKVTMEHLESSHVNPVFQNDIAALPDIYDDTNLMSCKKFADFFDKWGTHYVKEVWLGGSIRVSCTLSSTGETELDQSEQSELMSSIAAKYLNLGTKARESSPSPKNDPFSKVYKESSLQITGGIIPTVTRLEDLTPTILSDWVESIYKNPAELEHSVKLAGYYACSAGKSKSGLKDATAKYLAKDFGKNQIPYTRKDGADKAIAISMAMNNSNSSNEKACFPLHSRVLTCSGWQEMSALCEQCKVVTAVVESVEESKFEYTWTDLIGFIHIDRDGVISCYEIDLDNGRKLLISSKHLLFTLASGVMKTVKAEMVCIGDYLLCVDRNATLDDVNLIETSVATVVRIQKKTIRGFCAPLTDAGTVVVDGVFVSCYANVESHALAHLSMAPLRIWMKSRELSISLIRCLLSRSVRSSSSDVKPFKCRNLMTCSGIHKYAEFLMFLRKCLALNDV